MKQFVDLRASEKYIGARFAWWDTITDTFEKYNGEMAWNNWDEFHEAYVGFEIQRYKELCPEWVF